MKTFFELKFDLDKHLKVFSRRHTRNSKKISTTYFEIGIKVKKRAKGRRSRRKKKRPYIGNLRRN